MYNHKKVEYSQNIPGVILLDFTLSNFKAYRRKPMLQRDHEQIPLQKKIHICLFLSLL